MRDQVEAYEFAVRRQGTALVSGDDTAAVDPRRRANRSLTTGAVIGALALGAAACVGLVSGSGASARQLPDDGVMVDSATGGAYVRIGGVLHPTLNLASARVIAGPRVTTVDSDALSAVPRGLPVGIPAAPDALPRDAALTAAPWTACSAPPTARTGARTTVTIGAAVPTPLPASASVVVTSGATSWLIQGGTRFQVDAAAATLLGLARVRPVAVAASALRLVPAGPTLRVPTIDGAGSRPRIALPIDVRVGDLLRVPSTGGRYLVLSHGITPVDPFAFALLAGGAGATHTVAARTIAEAPSLPRPASVPAQWPRQTTPEPTEPTEGAPICVTADPAGHGHGVAVSEPEASPRLAGARRSASAPARSPRPTPAEVPAGGGVLVAAGSGHYALVTDSGLRYPISGAETVRRLGYDVARAVSVPRSFVTLLPPGPGLDPSAARAQYTGVTS